MTRALQIVVFFAALTMTSPFATADGPRVDEWGQSATDQAIEQFLLTADIIKIEDIGEGTTKPQRLTLQQADVTCRAIYKNVDIHSNEIAFTNRFETSFHDSYAYEVAAYRLDRLLNINLVPVTVLREVNGVPGSVQLWIENATSLQTVVDAGIECKNPERLLHKFMLVYVLDALISNIDRNYGNILVDTEEKIFYLIDHSRSFRNSKKLPKLQEARPIPAEVMEGIRKLDRTILDARLDDLITKSQRKAIMKRRDRLIDQLGQRSSIPPVLVADASTATVPTS